MIKPKSVTNNWIWPIKNTLLSRRCSTLARTFLLMKLTRKRVQHSALQSKDFSIPLMMQIILFNVSILQCELKQLTIYFSVMQFDYKFNYNSSTVGIIIFPAMMLEIKQGFLPIDQRIISVS